jgi:uncharacterized membrane-anchored protein YitT (DUF2179 family)
MKPTHGKAFTSVFNMTTVFDYLWIVVGCMIQALGMVYFLIPAHLISGGVSGIAQVINALSGWPIGMMTFLGNLPLFLIGWRYLGGRRFAFRTVTAVVCFSLLTDLFSSLTKQIPITDDLILNTLYGSVLLGIGFGMVYRGSGTSGGSDIIGRILNQRLGMPISQSYLLTDSVSVILGGLTFGWDLALYGLIAIYISGIAAEMISEGSGVFRQAIIITDHPEAIIEGVITQLERGVTKIQGTGAYSGKEKTVLYCVVIRSEVIRLKRLVNEADPAAFMVVGQAHEVMGEGFQGYKSLNG